VPDALTTLCRLLATLHDERGEVAVQGLHAGPASDLDYPEDRFRAESSALDGVELVGSGSLVERLWTKPTINVIGIDAPSVAECSNTLVPRARAAVSLRVAPGQAAGEALDLLVAHLESHVPFGARLRVLETSTGAATAIDASGPAYDAARAAFAEAWDGTEPVDIGVGGSIPFIAAFREAFPEASVLVTGVEDPDTRAHSTDEGLHLGEFRRACLAETLLLRNLAR
jgi:acetylornithine deacetylase/succinyl-diaminopimelate desuccinylase-like protein